MTYKEKVSFNKAYRYYVGQGYPKHVAKQYAYDHLYIDRNTENNKFKELFI